ALGFTETRARGERGGPRASRQGAPFARPSLGHSVDHRTRDARRDAPPDRPRTPRSLPAREAGSRSRAKDRKRSGSRPPRGGARRRARDLEPGWGRSAPPRLLRADGGDRLAAPFGRDLLLRAPVRRGPDARRSGTPLRDLAALLRARPRLGRLALRVREHGK